MYFAYSHFSPINLSFPYAQSQMPFICPSEFPLQFAPSHLCIISDLPNHQLSIFNLPQSYKSPTHDPITEYHYSELCNCKRHLLGPTQIFFLKTVKFLSQVNNEDISVISASKDENVSFLENSKPDNFPTSQHSFSQLPLENWTDLLPFVPRRQLVEIVKQMGDRQFAKILQFFLTKVGQITLGHLRIVAPRENDPNGGGGPIVEVRKEMPPFLSEWIRRPPSDLETNLPKGPMPNNVKDFKLIELSYFDMSIANFLHQFQQEQQPGNSLLDNVNLCFFSPLLSRYENNIIRILAHLMPMIGNISSMSICYLEHMEFGCVGLGPNNAASQLLTMLTNARILEIQ